MNPIINTNKSYNLRKMGSNNSPLQRKLKENLKYNYKYNITKH